MRPKAWLWQIIALPLIIVLDAALVVTALHTASHNKYSQIAASQNSQNQAEESLWAPGTWGPVTVFTLVLASTAVAQAMLFVWQLGLISEGAADAAKAANAAAEQTRLARHEFNATHRPRLKLRAATVTEYAAGKPMGVLFRIANVGDALARTIIFQREIATCAPGEFVRGLPRYVHPPSIVGGEILPGDYFEVSYTGELAADQLDVQAVSMGALELILYGEITCADANGHAHRSGFFRRYDPNKGRFCIADDPDLDYDD